MESRHHRGRLVGLHEAELRLYVALLLERVHEVEGGIDGRLVDALQIAEIRLADVDGLHRERAADGEEEERRDGCHPCHAFPRPGLRDADGADRLHQQPEDAGSEKENGHHAAEGLEESRAGERRRGGGGEIEDRRVVEALPPVGIEHDIEHEHHAEQQGSEAVVYALRPERLRAPAGHAEDDEYGGYDGEVSGHREVERQAVEESSEPLRGRRMGLKMAVDGHKHSSLQREERHKQQESEEKFLAGGFHSCLNNEGRSFKLPFRM